MPTTPPTLLAWFMKQIKQKGKLIRHHIFSASSLLIKLEAVNTEETERGKIE